MCIILSEYLFERYAYMKRICLCIAFLFCLNMTAAAAPETEAKSAVLMEQSTGRVLFEQNAHEKLPPASVTKVMTMLLTMEAIDGGNLTYDTIVTASERAKSMGGSTIFLDTNEQMSVNDLLKGIAVASGNDACVAMAEHIAGSEQGFVDMMNNRASELGMNDTSFKNTNGLDADGHLTSAYDIALMSRELLKHEDILKYTGIWMDSLRDGKFGLANTNRLIRFYSGANGLKTGSTSKAGFCISATAKRDGMQLIGVIMGSETSDKRFASAKLLLDYGFANYMIADPSENAEITDEVPVKHGMAQSVKAEIVPGGKILIEKNKKKDIKSEYVLNDFVEAPVKKGDIIGKITFKCGDETVWESDLAASEDVPRKTLFAVFAETVLKWVR